MDIPMSWLKEYANVTTDIKNFIEDITMTGSKVEGYYGVGVSNGQCYKVTDSEGLLSAVVY